jgi:heme-degrading monooxygenase HmoA
MVKVIVEYKLKKGAEIGPLLLRLRTAAMSQKGHISSETLIGSEDRSTILVISTWDNVENWKTWRNSSERAQIENAIESLLSEKPVIGAYEVMSSEELEYLEDPSGWLQNKERSHLGG